MNNNKFYVNPKFSIGIVDVDGEFISTGTTSKLSIDSDTDKALYRKLIVPLLNAGYDESDIVVRAECSPRFATEADIVHIPQKAIPTKTKRKRA